MTASRIGLSQHVYVIPRYKTFVEKVAALAWKLGGKNSFQLLDYTMAAKEQRKTKQDDDSFGQSVTKRYPV